MFNIFKKRHTENTSSENKSKPTLRERLTKSREKIGDSLSSLLLGKKYIDDDLLEELETILISADIGLKTTDQVIESVRQKSSRKDLSDPSSLYNLVKEELLSIIVEDNEMSEINAKPFVILVVGVNGAGKTTSIGKLAKSFQQAGKTVMLAAADTYRAAAVEQLKVWGERNDVPVVAQSTGSDAASVIFDAYDSAKAKGIDILIADTAGRLHTQKNLMQELEKIDRVIKKQDPQAPHETMLVVDGTAGQNALNQAVDFNKLLNITGITITKLDGTAKGGVLFSISNELKLPIRFIGVGEGIDDLRVFNAKKFVDAIFN
ncbi:signal recognition particle-docking protein FtsY [Gammaproteobacteria bacterium]|nr:signal recognition particle-docking protein FtsY [Gammaproteobacteria bacterium]